jgi:hypothetical protein
LDPETTFASDEAVDGILYLSQSLVILETMPDGIDRVALYLTHDEIKDSSIDGVSYDFRAH